MDPKVIEFLRILEEYRVKCEMEGNYIEASRANKQLSILRKQEEKRQQKAIRARQILERQDVQIAHSMQFHDFNTSWDKYMEEFDVMAQNYIQQMTERHALILLDYQKSLNYELNKKPHKWSKELMDSRKKQTMYAKTKNYIEAQKLKKICDMIESKELLQIQQTLSIIYARKEALFRLHQSNELQALLKRIECRRKEHLKQRNLDCKRLLQRNHNVQVVLESKQNLESLKLYEDIKKNLLSSQFLSIELKQQLKVSRNTLPVIKRGFNNNNNEEQSQMLQTQQQSPSYDQNYSNNQNQYPTLNEYANDNNNNNNNESNDKFGLGYDELDDENNDINVHPVDDNDPEFLISNGPYIEGY